MEEKMTKTEIARQKRESRMRAEMERVEKMRSFERDAVRAAGGSGPVCGIDEAGRGPLAGPVAAAAVILPEDLVLPWLNDSKKVTEKRREVLYRQITEKAVSWAVVMVPPERIDEINILQATYEAMRSAVSRLSVRPGVLVNDAVTIPDVDILQVPVIKGDARCISVAAASILAKVTRDAYMKEMDLKYPVYGFAGHKGYGTKTHCAAILEHGPCPIHRRSFLGRLLAGSAWDLHDLQEAADHPSSRRWDGSARTRLSVSLKKRVSGSLSGISGHGRARSTSSPARKGSLFLRKSSTAKICASETLLRQWDRRNRRTSVKPPSITSTGGDTAHRLPCALTSWR